MSHKQLDFYEVMERKPSTDSLPEIIIVLDDLRFPENIAGIFRLADCFAVSEVWIQSNQELILSKGFRSISRVHEEKINFSLLSKEEIIERFKTKQAENYQVIGIEFTNASTPLNAFEFPEKYILICGSERYGINDDYLKLCDACVHIPMLGTLSSLNVQQAASIALYAARN